MFESSTGFTEANPLSDQDELLNEFLRRLPRQAPGSEVETKNILSSLSLLPNKPYTIVAYHCGTGAIPLELASRFDGNIIAVDPRAELLDVLLATSETMSLRAKINATTDDVVELPLVKGSIDLVWSEHPNHASSFERVIQHWQALLKPSGMMVLTELIWLTPEHPAALTSYFESANKDIATLEERLDQLEANGYEVLRGDILPTDCHTTNYYQPMSALFDSFVDEFKTPSAVGVVAKLMHELSIYNKYSEYYGYAVFIARKV